jgi:hypothetical protein
MTKETAQFLLDIVWEQIADAEAYVSTDDDEDGVYADRLVQLVKAEQALLEV